MATLRSDLIIPEIFTPYVIEQSTIRDAFLSSGVVQPMAELNATEGGDYINVPFFKANLTGDFEVLTDSSSLTPGKITADKQVGVVLHRGRAFESRDLAALAAGADPMAAIAAKVSEYIANQRQKDLIKCLEGVFGGLTSNTGAAFAGLSLDLSGMTALGPRQCAKARSLLVHLQHLLRQSLTAYHQPGLGHSLHVCLHLLIHHAQRYQQQFRLRCQ